MGTKLDPVNANSRERRRLSQGLVTRGDSWNSGYDLYTHHAVEAGDISVPILWEPFFLFSVIANTNNVSPCSGPRLSEIAIATRVARVRNVNLQHFLKRTRKVRTIFYTNQESVSWACLRQGLCRQARSAGGGWWERALSTSLEWWEGTVIASDWGRGNAWAPATALVGASYTYLFLVLIGSLSYLRQLWLAKVITNTLLISVSNLLYIYKNISLGGKTFTLFTRKLRFAPNKHRPQ